jgi:adenosylhomocysteine nucleosidase
MPNPRCSVVVIVSADAEWKVVRQLYPAAAYEKSPFGEWFAGIQAFPDSTGEGIVFQGGWGKISAAASAQYVIDRWQPQVLVNLGTCGGFDGRILKGEIILAERTCVYDIIEQMADPLDALEHYSTHLDLSWLAEPYPQPVRKGLLLSADRDLVAGEVAGLVERFDGVAGDWESGAIAWVAQQNHTRCLILRGVTDLVNADGGEAYGDFSVFEAGTRQVMESLFNHLPLWLQRIKK